MDAKVRENAKQRLIVVPGLQSLILHDTKDLCGTKALYKTSTPICPNCCVPRAGKFCHECGVSLPTAATVAENDDAAAALKAVTKSLSEMIGLDLHVATATV